MAKRKKPLPLPDPLAAQEAWDLETAAELGRRVYQLGGKLRAALTTEAEKRSEYALARKHRAKVEAELLALTEDFRPGHYPLLETAGNGQE